MARHWRVGRVFVGGDAAHQMPPKAGQGLCAGFRDAANLAWKLSAAAGRGARDWRLETYESERWPNVLAYIEFSRALSDVMLAAANGGVPPEFNASAPPPVPPLGPGLHGDAQPPAGTRSRQPRLADGRRLDDAAGYRFTVLGRPSVLRQVSRETRTVWAAADVAVVADTGSDVEEWLTDLGAGAVFIRPDRFLLGAALDADRMTAGLAQALDIK